MNIATYVRLIDDAERQLAEGFRTVADGHQEEPDVQWLCHILAGQSRTHSELLAPARERYGQDWKQDEPAQLRSELLPHTRTGPVGLLRDLQDLHTLCSFVRVTWTLLLQAAYGPG